MLRPLHSILYLAVVWKEERAREICISDAMPHINRAKENIREVCIVVGLLMSMSVFQGALCLGFFPPLLFVICFYTKTLKCGAVHLFFFLFFFNKINAVFSLRHRRLRAIAITHVSNHSNVSLPHTPAFHLRIR